jgi:serine/threonine protein kinase
MALILNSGDLFTPDFRVVRPLSTGGMGALYIVEQVKTGKRRALKLMQEGASDPASRRRFQQEARIGALVESEHVVDVIAAGVEGDTPWLVMELLEGEDLGQFVDRSGPVTGPLAGDIFRQLCHAIAAAHDIPVVHRDLKPENIFLAKPRRAGSGFLVKVLDFGIAKIVTADARRTGQVGTPLWMAPEQTEASAALSPAADVWALGLVAFRVLTGHYFWHSAHGDSTVQLLREILVDPLPNVLDRAQELRARLPPGFDEWFHRCVDRDPSRRFQHAREAWSALAPVLESPRDSIGTTGPRVRVGGTHSGHSAFARTESELPMPVSAPPPLARPANASTRDGVSTSFLPLPSSIAPARGFRGARIAIGLAVACAAAAALFVLRPPAPAHPAASPATSDLPPIVAAPPASAPPVHLTNADAPAPSAEVNPVAPAVPAASISPPPEPPLSPPFPSRRGGTRRVPTAPAGARPPAPPTAAASPSPARPAPSASPNSNPDFLFGP